MAELNLEKLPKAARQEIMTLRTEIARLQTALAVHEGRVSANIGITQDGCWVPLPGRRVRFGQYPQGLEVHWVGTRIKLYGDRALSIRPQGANHLEVQVL